VPKEYDLQITSEAVNNTFVFTEQDLPGFKSKSTNKLEPDMPAWLNRERTREKSGADKQPWDKSKRFQPYYRRAIPKKTTLLGQVAHEVNCVAVLSEEAEAILAERTREAMRPKVGTMYMQNDQLSERGFIQPGTVRSSGAFTGFIKNTGTKKSKTQEIKTARIPRNELMDRIMDSFRRYNYWSMKALRAELQQPEAYIRQTLEEVADIARSGRFAMLWSLKPDYKQENYAGLDDGVAPLGMGGDGAGDEDLLEGDGEGEGMDEGLDEEDEEGDDVKMEDVLPL